MAGTAESTSGGAADPHSDGTISTTGVQNTAGTASTSSTSTSSSRLSPAAYGGIGAGVTIGVLLLVAAAAYFTGFVTFGKKRVTLNDAASTTSSEQPMKQARA